MLPVQVDAWYRSGASGIAISVASLALATGALASLLLRLTGSLTACADRRGADHPEPERPVPAEHADDRAAAVRSLIPGSCGDRPMAGRLSSAHTVGGRGGTGGCLSDAVRGVGDHRRRHSCSPAVLLLRRGHPARATLRASASLALWPAIAIIVFTINSRWVVGDWFVTGDFFVPENVDAIGNPAEAWRQIDEGLRQLSGRALVWAGYAGAVAVVVAAIRSTARSSLALLLALARRRGTTHGRLPSGASVSHQIRPAAGRRRCRARCGWDQCGASANSTDRRVVAAAGRSPRSDAPRSQRAARSRIAARSRGYGAGAARSPAIFKATTTVRPS